jgi:hypothetical protein
VAEIAQCYCQPGPGDQYRDEQRQDGQSDVVAGADARIICEHGDEVRGPDAKTRGSRIQAQPNQPLPTCYDLSAMEEADGDAACQKANAGRQHHKTPVMLDRQAS